MPSDYVSEMRWRHSTFQLFLCLEMVNFDLQSFLEPIMDAKAIDETVLTGAFAFVMLLQLSLFAAALSPCRLFVWR